MTSPAKHEPKAGRKPASAVSRFRAPWSSTDTEAPGRGWPSAVAAAGGVPLSCLIASSVSLCAVLLTFAASAGAHTPQCRDAVDNDSDGKVDYPADPECSSPEGESEGAGAPPPPPPPPREGGRPYRASMVDHPDGQSWGARGAATGDLNGDGVNDLFVKGVGPQALCGPAIYALSGADRSELYRIDPPSCTGGFDVISPLGDVNGDAVLDVVLGTGFSGKEAYVFSGKNGALMHALVSPNTQGLFDGQDNDRFGDRVGNAGDITGDGRSDVLVGAPGTNAPTGCTVATDPDCRLGQGRAYVFNGATGRLERTLELPPDAEDVPAACGENGCSFGSAVQGPGDVDADGTQDQLVGASGAGAGHGRMYLFSGKTGALIRAIAPPETDAPRGGIFGFQEAAPRSPGDVNGDGHADLYGSNFEKDGTAGTFEGRAWVFDGSSCATPAGVCSVLYELRDPTPQQAGNFGWSMDSVDYDSDGTPDLYVGQAPHHGDTGEGGTAVFSGKDGSLLKVLDLPPEDRVPGDDNAKLGYFVAAPGDLNGDQAPDFVAGAEGKDIGEGREGALYAFLSSPFPAISLADVSVTEGDVGLSDAAFTISLSTVSDRPVSVDFATADNTATAPGDYTSQTGSLTFAPGEQSKTVAVKVVGDRLDEPDERFLMNLSNPVGGSIADPQGVARITDDDEPVNAFGGAGGAGLRAPGAPADGVRAPGAPGDLGCLQLRAGLRGKRLGPARLGRSRRRQRRRLATVPRRSRGGIDRYCLAGGGSLRIGYPTARLRRTLRRSERRRLGQRALLVLSSSTRFTASGVEPGSGADELRIRLRGERRLRVGRNVWYLARGSGATRVFRTRAGRVVEIGLADKRLTRNRRFAKRLLGAWRL